MTESPWNPVIEATLRLNLAAIPHDVDPFDALAAEVADLHTNLIECVKQTLRRTPAE